VCDLSSRPVPQNWAVWTLRAWSRISRVPSRLGTRVPASTFWQIRLASSSVVFRYRIGFMAGRVLSRDMQCCFFLQCLGLCEDRRGTLTGMRVSLSW
jgi:hypothetical protein